MTGQSQKFGSAQNGIVLVSSLLLLLIVTIMALSIFRSFGIQEKIAGNTREKQRAIQAATSAQQFAEEWLVSPSSGAVAALSTGYASSLDIACSKVVSADTGSGQICANTPLSLGITLTSPPWSVGVDYTPPGINSGSGDSYAMVPRFYITDLGSMGVNTEMYKIDAYAYSLNGNNLASAVAVVESTFQMKCIVCGLGAL